MIDTTLLVPEIADHQSEIQQTRFRDEARKSLRHALEGLEPLSVEQRAAYLTAHPKLLANISYLPNAITAQMVEEALAD